MPFSQNPKHSIIYPITFAVTPITVITKKSAISIIVHSRIRNIVIIKITSSGRKDEK